MRVSEEKNMKSATDFNLMWDLSLYLNFELFLWLPCNCQELIEYVVMEKDHH